MAGNTCAALFHRRICRIAFVALCGVTMASSAQAGPRDPDELLPFRLTADDHGGLRPWNEIHAEMRELTMIYPQQTQLDEIGRSAEGREMLALRVADDPADETRPTVLLVAAHHANEAGTPEHALDAARFLLTHRDEEPYATWLARMTLVVVPMVNPDGSHAFWEIDFRMGRKNRRRVDAAQERIGVDLNRNYPFEWHGPERRFSSSSANSRFYRGPSPVSEPEVMAMVEFGQQERPVAMISYHSAAAKLLVPYAIPGVRNPDPSTAWSVAQEMLAAMPHVFGRRRFRAVGRLYPVTGVEKDWYYHSFGTLAYLVELPYRRPRAARLQESLEHTRGAWMALFDRWLNGPALSVRAVDPDGVPVSVSVQFDEIATHAGEHWETHPQHGWFHHYLPESGTYTVRLATGEYEVVQQVEVGEGWTQVEIEVAAPQTLVARAAQ